MSTAFVFSIDTNALQFEACLLAASIRRHLGDGPDLIAALPEEKDIHELDGTARRILADLQIRVEPVSNPIGGDYKIGYKMPALDVPTSANRIVFLDSDMMCMRPFDPDSTFGDGFAAKPVDLPGRAASPGYWRLIYGTCMTRMPDRRVRTTVSGDIIPPYFNAGVVSVPAGSDFGRLWSRLARRIDRAPWIRWKRPWLDQLALPVAVERARLPSTVLTEAENHPTHIVGLPRALPVFSHYHGPDVVAREPRIESQVRDLLASTPDLADLGRKFPPWRVLIDRPEAIRVDPDEGRTLVIGGIPGDLSQAGAQLGGDDVCIVRDPPGFWKAVARPVLDRPVRTWMNAMRQHIQTCDLDDREVRRPLGFGPEDADPDRRTGGLPRHLVIDGGGRVPRDLERVLRAAPDARVLILVADAEEAVAHWRHRPDLLVQGAPTDPEALAMRWAESVEHVLARGDDVAVVSMDAWRRHPQHVVDRLWRHWGWGRAPKVSSRTAPPGPPHLSAAVRAQVHGITCEARRRLESEARSWHEGTGP